MSDKINNTKTTYEYDLSGRTIATSIKDSISSLLGIRFKYENGKNRLTSYNVNLGKIGLNYTTSFTYGNSASGQNLDAVYRVKLNSDDKLQYEYDELGRLKTRKLLFTPTSTPFNTIYTYKNNITPGSNQTSALVDSITNGSNTLSYTYDANSNITDISKSGSSTSNESYGYDSLNQLTSAAIGSDTYSYTYDNGGNILSATKNGETNSYGYTNANWKDLLTNFNGQTITYDAIGNPLQYRSGYSFTWQNGRQLATVTNTGINISYTYNVDGIRTSKTVNGVTTNYYVLDGVLYGEQTGNNYISYLYDEKGNKYGMIYNQNGTESYYYYVYNAQGDVIGIIDSSGSTVVEYTYDAWGNILSTTGSLATTLGTANPIRYRGYYYDAETGLYYVSSRYYDPETCRFINADSQLNPKDGMLGYNMFAYCNNNPVMYSDPSGHSIILACIIGGAIIGALAGGHIAAKVSKKKTGKVNGWAVAGGIAGGAVVGGLIGWGVGAAVTAIGAAAAGTAATTAAPVVQKVAEKATTAIQTYYPPNDGFAGAIEKVSLDVGTLLQRTGSLYGSYVAPAGTPSQMLSLPYDKIGQVTTYLQVQQPLQAIGGQVAPWFGQIGGGTQYLLNSPVNQLITDGILKIMGD